VGVALSLHWSGLQYPTSSMAYRGKYRFGGGRPNRFMKSFIKPKKLPGQRRFKTRGFAVR